MKLIDVYKENKVKYPKYVIMIKVGNFYEIYGEEVYILNNLFNYKIKKVGNNDRVGFPIIAYNKVINKFDKFKINYIIIDKENIKKRFNKNNYDKYLSKDLNIDNRIHIINEKLQYLKESKNVNQILDKIEEVL